MHISKGLPIEVINMKLQPLFEEFNSEFVLTDLYLSQFITSYKNVRNLVHKQTLFFHEILQEHDVKKIKKRFEKIARFHNIMGIEVDYMFLGVDFLFRLFNEAIEVKHLTLPKEKIALLHSIAQEAIANVYTKELFKETLLLIKTQNCSKHTPYTSSKRCSTLLSIITPPILKQITPVAL